MDLLALCRDLIAADTVSHKGTDAAVRVLLPLYEQAGLNVQIQEEVRDGARHQNLVGTYPGTDAGGLLLVTHLDTVDPGPLEMWTETSPYQLLQKEDRVYGLGSADTKLDALCKLMAARELRGRPLRRSLQLLGTFEEEVGAIGAKRFVKSDLFKARFAACSEPSELVIIRAHKGYAVVRTELALSDVRPVTGPLTKRVIDGKAAHSSTPHLGVNAIEKALEEAGDLAILSIDGGSVANKVPARCTVVRAARSGEPVLSPPPADVSEGTATAALARQLFEAWKRLALAQVPATNPAFDPSTSVVNWGVAKLDGPRAELVFDCRLLPGHDPDALVQAFTDEAARLCTQARAIVKVEADRASPAMELREPSELLSAARAACRDVGLNDTPAAKPTNTEAGVFARAGIESIVFGPGRSTGNAHCANEHNLHSQLLKAVDFYRALIARLCV